jgi:hypothetical protein
MADIVSQKQKHAPIGPRNTVILFKDNPDLDKAPLKRGVPEPEKLVLKLKDTKGNWHKRFFPEKDEEKWDDAKWISECNKWRNQVLRRLMKRDPTWSARGIRPKWGMREAMALKAEVKKKVNDVGNRKLTGQEWQDVTDAHNKRCATDKLRAGERLLGGDLNKSDQDIGPRTTTSIKSLFDRNVELKTWFRDLIVETDEAGDGDNNGVVDGIEDVEVKRKAQEDGDERESEAETESEEANPTKKRKTHHHAGEIDPRLEDPSDDEDEGRRQASNQTGAGLIACA